MYGNDNSSSKPVLPKPLGGKLTSVSYPFVSRAAHLAPERENRRVSIDVIDTSKLQSYIKTSEEEENERLEALKEIDVTGSSSLEEDKIIDLVTSLLSKIVRTNIITITLIGAGDKLLNLGRKRGKGIQKDVYKEVIDSNAVVILNTDDDDRFVASEYKFFAGVPLRYHNKSVGVLAVLDSVEREDVSDLEIEIMEDAAKVVVERLLSIKTEMDRRDKLEREIEEQKRLATIEMELKRKEMTPSPSPQQSLVDLEEVYMTWMEEDLASGDQLSHINWIDDWNNPYPKPPVAANDKDRSSAASFYKSLIEDNTRSLFNEMCSNICTMLNFPMCVLGIVTDNTYFAEAQTTNMSLTSVPREVVLCNYTLKKGQTFVVPDFKDSPMFNKMPMASMLGYGFYAGAPLCTSDGYAIGTVCVLDFVNRKDFNVRKQKQLSAFASGFMRHLELRRLKMQNIELHLETERLNKRLISNKETLPTDGEVTFVCTDVENSTPLWEHHSSSMNLALQLHDQLIRSCLSLCFGYEIGTEGDSFELVFHSAVDAVKWCLLVQEKLLSLSWPEDILNSQYSPSLFNKEGEPLFRGLRVRMAIHTSDEYEHSTQEVSQRERYFGRGINKSRTLSAFASGGQILVSEATFELVNSSLDNLNNPFIIDLGRHSLDNKNLEMNVYQMLPSSLGPKYCSDKVKRDEMIEGRTFPRLKTYKLLSPSYFDAPQKGIVHQVFTILDKNTRANLSLSSLMRPQPDSSVISLFSSLLTKHNGYICHSEHGSFMLAFHTAFDAAAWCVFTMQKLKDPLLFSGSRVPTVQMGIHSGKFEDCRPHPLTGRMYYFGSVVNRTARIAHKASDGQVFASKETILELQQTTSASMKKLFLVQDEGEYNLKGVTVPVSICSIIKRQAELTSESSE